MRLFSRSSLSLKGEGKGEGDHPIRSPQLLPATPSELVLLGEPRGQSFNLDILLFRACSSFAAKILPFVLFLLRLIF